MNFNFIFTFTFTFTFTFDCTNHEGLLLLRLAELLLTKIGNKAIGHYPSLSRLLMSGRCYSFVFLFYTAFSGKHSGPSVLDVCWYVQWARCAGCLLVSTVGPLCWISAGKYSGPEVVDICC